jgi:DNA-binding YbaB/EbfC family protein
MFKGLGNLANLGAMLKQAQEMGSKLQKVNEELKDRRVSGSTAGGLVKVEVNGVGEVLKCRIDPSLLQETDRELLEDLLPAAINDALAKGRQMHAEAMQSLAGGLNLPGLDSALAELAGKDPGGGTSG